MASDLKIDIDGIRLNVRVGVVMRHNDDVVLEISTVGRNSVVPGGRIRINEHSTDALIRELGEEMKFEPNKTKLTQIKVFENFFDYDDKRIHELYFLYEYILDDKEREYITNLKVNYDNNTTYFSFVNKNELNKYNLLPLELHDIIKN